MTHGHASARVGALAERLAILVLAAAVIGFFIVHGFYVERHAGIEEIVAFSAAHSFGFLGHAAFPAFAWNYGPRLYETLGIHPHVHYAFIGAMLKLGFGVRAAEALPIIGTAALTTLLVVTSRIAAPIKVGLLFSLAASLALGMDTMADHIMAARPEYHAAIAGLAGVVALEAGRLGGWDARRLLLGAFLLTFASGLQWNSMGAFLGVGVYATWALWQLGPRAAWPKLLALAAGGLLFGVPYIVLYILPNWDLINAVRQQNQTQGPGIWQDNMANYGWFKQTLTPPALSGTMRFSAGPVALGLATGLPPFLFGVALLMLVPSARTIGLALLPMPLYSFVAVTIHKGYYYLPDFLVTIIGVAVAVSVTIAAIAGRMLGEWGRRAATIALAAVLGYGVWTSSPRLQGGGLAATHIPSSMDVARAAAREIIGPSALVTSQHQSWYVAGAKYWYDYTPDILRGDSSESPLEFFRRFDSVAEAPYWSYSPQALKESPWSTPVAALYAERQLALQGFYSDTPNFSYSLFGVAAGEPVRGYVRRGQVLYRFEAGTDPRHVLSVLICPLDETFNIPETSGYAPSFEGEAILFIDISNAFVPYRHPRQAGDRAQLTAGPDPEKIRAVVMSRERHEAESRRLTQRCRVHEALTGRLTVVDLFELGNGLRYEDRAVRPFYYLDEALAARHADPTGTRAATVR